MVKSKYVIEKEIEVLNESKDTDKIEYQNSVNVYLGLLALMTSLVIFFGYKSRLPFISLVITWLLLFLGITAYGHFTWFKKIRDVFARKHEMVRKRYKKLGVDLASLDRELKKK